MSMSGCCLRTSSDPSGKYADQRIYCCPMQPPRRDEQCAADADGRQLARRCAAFGGRHLSCGLRVGSVWLTDSRATPGRVGCKSTTFARSPPTTRTAGSRGPEMAAKESMAEAKATDSVANSAAAAVRVLCLRTLGAGVEFCAIRPCCCTARCEDSIFVAREQVVR